MPLGKRSSPATHRSEVAMFAQLLKDSHFKGTATFDEVIDHACSVLDNDHKGYRREFVGMVETTKSLK